MTLVTRLCSKSCEVLQPSPTVVSIDSDSMAADTGGSNGVLDQPESRPQEPEVIVLIRALQKETCPSGGVPTKSNSSVAQEGRGPGVIGHWGENLHVQTAKKNW